jgi:UPF0271 protein
MNGRRIDFNCDVGEGCGDDAAILPWVSSANIACGGHAGDADTMRATLRLCRALGIAAGAHPGFDDPVHFGRRPLALPGEAITRLVREQLARLAALAAEEGVRLTHAKPHGALYNQAADDRAIAEAVVAAIVDSDASLALYALSGSQLAHAGEAAGLRVAHEVFAERGYDATGRLLPRGQPGAVLESLGQAVAQARELAGHGRVRSAAGDCLRLRADTLCLHGDRDDAAGFARALRGALEADGIEVVAFGAMR